MLTFIGLDVDDAARRAAKLKALQTYFDTSPATSFHLLSRTSLSTSNASRGRELIVSAHGDAKSFGGYTPEHFYDLLESKGFGPGSFARFYLMALSADTQQQDYGLLDDFARALHRILIREGIQISLYAPRRYLDYELHVEIRRDQTFYVANKMFIKAPEREYPLSEGMLLVQ